MAPGLNQVIQGSVGRLLIARRVGGVRARNVDSVRGTIRD